jgi:hypothetical protein
VVITTYLAKETIGHTPAPSALPQYQLGTPCTTLRTPPHELLAQVEPFKPSGALQMCWLFGREEDNRSEWGQATMKGKKIWWAWLPVITTHKKRSTLYKTSSTLMIMKIELTSCMEITILGRE